jgi:ferric-dicitrate binding protein FerR (iron transport regulator)
LEGSINLELTTPSGEQTARMKPGSIAQYDRKTGQLTMSEFDRSAFSALKKGRGLYYNNISMQDIATALSRVFGKKIVVADEKLAQTRYFAIFTNNESLDNILSAINSDGRMDISERDDTIYLNSK